MKTSPHHKTLRLGLLVYLLLMLSVQAAPLRGWKLTLSDGSKLHIEHRSEMLEMVSKPLDARVQLPAPSIHKLESIEDGQVRVTLSNGDQLTGTLSGPPLKANTVFGECAIPVDVIRGIERSENPVLDAKLNPPGEFQIDYAGLRWDIWRTGWAVEDGVLASQRHVRPGFDYGHWARGRGGMVITGNGDKNWKDYELAFDYKMLPANREFFHAHIPGDSRGMALFFRAADLTESWNDPDTSYVLGINPEGGWSLSARNGCHMTGKGWNSSRKVGKSEKLISGQVEQGGDVGEGRLRLRVEGQTISAWLNDERLFEFTHDGGEMEPVTYGGFGVQWKWESMGEISNLEVERL